MTEEYERLWDEEVKRKGAVESAIGDNPEKSFEDELKLMKQYLKEPILDAGCGYGRLLKEFDDISGIDVSSKMLNEARTTGKHVFKGSITDLSMFDNDSFNAIICDKVLLHLTDDDVIKSLKEFNRILSDKGRIFLTFPLKRRAIIWNLKMIFRIVFNKTSAISARTYTKPKIMSFIRSSGFTIIYQKESSTFGYYIIIVEKGSS